MKIEFVSKKTGTNIFCEIIKLNKKSVTFINASGNKVNKSFTKLSNSNTCYYYIVN